MSQLLTANTRRMPVRVGGKAMWMRLLTAQESLVCRAQAKELAVYLQSIDRELPDQDAQAVAFNACLCAHCLTGRRHRPVYESGRDALSALTLDELAYGASLYAQLKKQTLGFSQLDGDALDALMSELAQSPFERIRWQVLRGLQKLPCDPVVQRMSEGDYIYCYAQMLLDGQEDDVEETGFNRSWADVVKRGGHDV